MFLARIVFFRLHESPRYLVHAGRPQEAIESLQMISRFNGSELSIELEDVQDHKPAVKLSPCEEDGSGIPFLSSHSRRNSADGANGYKTQAADTPDKVESPLRTIFDADGLDVNPRPSLTAQRSAEFLRGGTPGVVKDYHSTGESPVPLESHSFATPVSAHIPGVTGPHEVEPTNPDSTEAEFKDVVPDISRRSRLPSPVPRPRSSLDASQRRASTSSRRSHRPGSIYEKQVRGVLPRWVRRPLEAWLYRVAMVLSPEWLKTTVLVWAMWCSMSLGEMLLAASWNTILRLYFRFLAYTMFNVFLPKLLETTSDEGIMELKTLEASLWDVVIFTIGGCPGAIVSFFSLIVNPRLADNYLMPLESWVHI